MTSPKNVLNLGGVRLPLEAITETIAILGIRGSGKTNTAAVYAEELLAAGQQLVVIDPTDSWYGLKSSADGQAPGFPVVILGGKHQDLPLAATDGKTIADFVVETGASVICSLRHFESKGQEHRFVNDFLRRLYFLKGQQDAPAPLAVIIDEASRNVPQRVMGEEAHVVGAVQQLVRQGRSTGFGVVLIDQRAATVNKDVLAQLEMLVVHRTTSPQDRAALKEWIRAHDTAGHEAEFLETLASLKVGEAWAWSPGWLDLFKRAQIRARKTYDSSRTPRAGERLAPVAKTADVDLEALKAKLAATIEQAKADDPKELHKRIAELERELARGARGMGVEEDEVQRRVDEAVQREAERNERSRRVLQDFAHQAADEILRIGAEVLDAGDHHQARLKAIGDRIDQAIHGLGAIAESEDAVGTRPVRPDPAPRSVPVSATPARSENENRPVERQRPVAAARQADSSLGGTAQRILDALAFFESVGQQAPTKKAVAAFIGVSAASGSWASRLSELRVPGYIMDPARDTVSLTDDGRARADSSTAPRSRRDLHDRWLDKLGGTSRRALEALIDVYPNAMEKSALAAHVGVSGQSGSWASRLSELRVPGLIEDVSRSEVRASATLFPRGLR